MDRHALSGRADKVALRCIARDDAVTDVTYAELARLTSRFANVLRELGVGRGDRVFTLLGRCPELVTTVLGTLKNTSVLCPLFSAFGPDPVEQRLRLGDARVLVTTAALYRKKVADRRDALPGLEHVLIVGPGAGDLPGTVSWNELTGTAVDSFSIPRRPARTWPCCTSPVAPPAPPKAPCMSMRQWSPTTPRPRTRSICTPRTCTGARPTPAG